MRLSTFFEHRVHLFAIALACFSGCDDDLIDDPGQSSTSAPGTTNSGMNSMGNSTMPGSTPGMMPGATPDPKVTHQQMGSEWVSKVNASSKSQWVYLDLDERRYPAADAQEQGAWDIAFQRVKVKLNGGVSGPGKVQAQAIDGATAYEMLQKAPSQGFGTDKMSEADPQTDPFKEQGMIFGRWYEYDQKTHVVMPKARAFVVQSGQNRFFKIKILNYYNEAKTSGHYTVQWSEIPSAY